MSSARVVKARAKRFGDQPNDWQTYHDLVATYLEDVVDVLDVGCGRGTVAPFPWDQYPHIRLTGIDPDPTAVENQALSAFTLMEGDPWPLASDSADLAISRYVLEHVDDPEGFFRNVHRVLRPNGRFVFLTANYRHPAMKVSALLSHRTKQRVLNASGIRDESDVFATRYRVNTTNQIREEATKAGFSVVDLEVREYQPITYLDFSLPSYWIAYSYYALLTRTRLEHTFGSSVLGCLEKRA